LGDEDDETVSAPPPPPPGDLVTVDEAVRSKFEVEADDVAPNKLDSVLPAERVNVGVTVKVDEDVYTEPAALPLEVIL